MGRTREYGSDGERQKAFRDRRKEELQRLRKATAKRPALPETAPLRTEIERLRQRVADLEAALEAALTTAEGVADSAPAKPAVSNGAVTASYTEPFPHVRGGIGGDDYESNKIRDWFENRIIEGAIGTGVVSHAASHLDWLSQAYWTNNGKPKACRRLSYQQKAAVIAERKRKRTAAMKGV